MNGNTSTLELEPLVLDSVSIETPAALPQSTRTTPSKTPRTFGDIIQELREQYRTPRYGATDQALTLLEEALHHDQFRRGDLSNTEKELLGLTIALAVVKHEFPVAYFFFREGVDVLRLIKPVDDSSRNPEQARPLDPLAHTLALHTLALGETSKSYFVLRHLDTHDGASTHTAEERCYDGLQNSRAKGLDLAHRLACTDLTSPASLPRTLHYLESAFNLGYGLGLRFVEEKNTLDTTVEGDHYARGLARGDQSDASSVNLQHSSFLYNKPHPDPDYARFRRDAQTLFATAVESYQETQSGPLQTLQELGLVTPAQFVSLLEHDLSNNLPTQATTYLMLLPYAERIHATHPAPDTSLAEAVAIFTTLHEVAVTGFNYAVLEKAHRSKNAAVRQFGEEHIDLTRFNQYHSLD